MEYWNFFCNVIVLKFRKVIGFLKREDGFLVVDSKEKLNLMNFFFFNIGINLIRNFLFIKVNVVIILKLVFVIKDVILLKFEIEKYLLDFKWNKVIGFD